MSTIANDNNFVPGHSSADDEISNKKKFKYRLTNLFKNKKSTQNFNMKNGNEEKVESISIIKV